MTETTTHTSFYTLQAKSPDGKIIPFSDLKDNVVLIVNTATQCGFTPQLSELQELHEKYTADGLVIIGFPCNQFGSQEPRTNDEMEQFCETEHGVTFQLTEKVEVNGPNTHPVFKFLKNELSGLFGSRIKWNFTKFLVDRDGIPFRRYGSTTKPSSIESDIQKLLDSE